MASSGRRNGGGGHNFLCLHKEPEYPKGYSLSFAIVASGGGGVNAAFEEWGDKLLARYGKSREVTYKDYSLNYLGYSTDNG